MYLRMVEKLTFDKHYTHCGPACRFDLSFGLSSFCAINVTLDCTDLVDLSETFRTGKDINLGVRSTDLCIPH